MLNLVAKIMLMLCIWNVAGTALPAAAASFFTNATDEVAQANDPCATGSYAVAPHSDDESDCDPTNCENEHCRFHQCHFGHCNFVVTQMRIQRITPDSSVSSIWPELAAESISLNSLIRPPIA